MKDFWEPKQSTTRIFECSLAAISILMLLGQSQDKAQACWQSWVIFVLVWNFNTPILRSECILMHFEGISLPQVDRMCSILTELFLCSSDRTHIFPAHRVICLMLLCPQQSYPWDILKIFRIYFRLLQFHIVTCYTFGNYKIVKSTYSFFLFRSCYYLEK